jgi:hypothetical protein
MYRLFSSDFNENFILATYLGNHTQILSLMQTYSVGAQLFHADG